MEPTTVGALRRALAELPDDAVVIDAASGHSLVDVDTDAPDTAVLLFLETDPRHRRAAVNTIHGQAHGAVVQVGGDHYGDLRF